MTPNKCCCSQFISDTLLPLAVMIITPQITILLPHIVVNNNSEFNIFSFAHLISNAWTSVYWFDIDCWTLVIGLAVWCLISLYLPGIKYYGPKHESGFRPEYWNSGFKFYVLSILMSATALSNISATHLYYKIPNLIAILIAFGFAFCLVLYLKGLVSPSPGYYRISGNPFYDFYWGIELYPSVGRFISLKQLVICRFSMMLWQIIILICWKANYETLDNSHIINWPLTASALLQSLYLAKFYYWEDGYMQTLDAVVERFGYYIAWGTIAFVPGFYSLTSLYMVKHSATKQFGALSFVLVVSAGVSMIALNYWADMQRQTVRDTNGKCNIWGKPAKVIRATYTDNSGKIHSSVLLYSGFWGLTRRTTYLFELITALIWCSPALLSSAMPYLYFIYLLLLLIHRSVRDDKRCSAKYTTYWTEYCNQVKYLLIPGIF